MHAPYYIVICGYSWFYDIFLHYLINGKIYLVKVIEHTMCADFLYNFSLKHFSFYGELNEI